MWIYQMQDLFFFLLSDQSLFGIQSIFFFLSMQITGEFSALSSLESLITSLFAFSGFERREERQSWPNTGSIHKSYCLGFITLEQYTRTFTQEEKKKKKQGRRKSNDIMLLFVGDLQLSECSFWDREMGCISTHTVSEGLD